MHIRGGCVLGLLLLGCGSDEPLKRWNTGGDAIRHVDLHLADDVRMHLASATVDELGNGSGSETTVEVPSLVIEGQRSEWSLVEGVVRLEGEVRVLRGDVVLTARMLDLRLVDERVTHAEATGNVRVEQGERVVIAGRAVLEGETGRLVLTENPRLTEGQRTLTATQITVHLDDDTMSCEACRLVLPEDAVGGLR